MEKETRISGRIKGEVVGTMARLGADGGRRYAVTIKRGQLSSY